MRYWSHSYLHVLHESSLHPEKITVWCGLCDGGVIRPYFFLDYQDVHITVNGNRYRSMITQYFWPQWDDMELKELEGVGERVILRNGPVGWLPRSCDFTPLKTKFY